MTIQADNDTYVMGRTIGEEQRLQTQADIIARPTRNLFVTAGIGPGMKVLDLGSGAGDVALLAAELVGPTGSVVGVDHNGTILETARRRAAEAGYSNVTFVAGDLRTIELAVEFDAIVGRCIFFHLADPVAALCNVLRHLRPGGIVAVHEPDPQPLRQANSYPLCPLIQRVSAWIADGLERGGADMQITLKLHQIFLDAGLDAPSMQGDVLCGGRVDFLQRACAWGAEITRSLLPIILREGIATADEVDIDTLAQRMFDEASSVKAVLRLPPTIVGAWTRKPKS